MLAIPYEILSCSWPRPAVVQDRRWVSAVEWDTPAMHVRPQPVWTSVEGAPLWTIDWRQLFRQGVGLHHSANADMRLFYVVFRIRVLHDGVLQFFDDDGSIVRRDGVVVHEDRSAHPAQKHALEVCAGEELEIAHWQLDGDWTWGARAARHEVDPSAAIELLAPYRDEVRCRLADPSGPALKLYTNGVQPARAVVAVYSLVLRGYVPRAVHLFGDNQWNTHARALFAELLPFANVVPQADVLERTAHAGGPGLADWARRHWFVMKAAVALWHAPNEFCLLDDDVFVLDDNRDALTAFARNDLVYMPDFEHGTRYRTAWSLGPRSARLATGRFNAGFYFMRNRRDPSASARYALRLNPARCEPYVWEQGLIACLFAAGPVHELPSSRYIFPLVDGLPGGVLGYDYGTNPCGFASVHFGGLGDKPNDAATLALVPDVLGSALRATTIAAE